MLAKDTEAVLRELGGLIEAPDRHTHRGTKQYHVRIDLKAPGVELVVDAPGILGNDTDPEGAPIQLVETGDVSNGTVEPEGDGSFTYLPDAGFNVLNWGKQKDIREVKQRVGDRMCLMGNVNPLEIGVRGTPDEVKEATLEVLEPIVEQFGIAVAFAFDVELVQVRVRPAHGDLQDIVQPGQGAERLRGGHEPRCHRTPPPLEKRTSGESTSRCSRERLASSSSSTRIPAPSRATGMRCPVLRQSWLPRIA